MKLECGSWLQRLEKKEKQGKYLKAMHLTEGSFEGIVHIKSPVIHLNQGHIFQTDGEIHVWKW